MSRFTWNAVSLALAAMMLAGSATAQKTFDSPQDAAQAMMDAAEKNDIAALQELFGPQGKDIIDTTDADGSKERRAAFARRAHEKIRIEQDPTNPDRATFTAGNDAWPFPVPLIRRDGKWQFDPEQGRVEILARRIGRNELTAIDICRGYVEAQMAYAGEDRNGDRILAYAQKAISSPGKRDGLYWEGASTPLVPKAFANADGGKNSQAYHGYYFRILKAQGPDAPGGALSYVVKGKMIGGFALVAWPAQYTVSGVKTFIVGDKGVVFEKDLGPNTAPLAIRMSKFNPDKTWHPVEKE